jgi:D-3-phosphoglycerate dehydrogenase
VFRVGLTRDFLNEREELGWGDIGLALLDEAPEVEWDVLAEKARELEARHVEGYDALLVLTPRVPGATVAASERLVLVARFGVGFDNVDVDACTEHGVVVTITPDGVRRPVAAAALTLMLAITHKLVIKDRLTRAGRWNERLDHFGMGLQGRTLGLVGLGNIGRDFVGLAAPLGAHLSAADPYVDPEDARALGVELLDLDDMLARSDVVLVFAPLNDTTRHLLDARRLALMRPSAYLVNVARGPIVDQGALTEALREGRLAGAALDVFEDEPVAPGDPLLALDNVIVTPHGIALTDEIALGNGTSACRAILDVAARRMPAQPLNPEAAERGRMKQRLERRAS